MKQKLCSLYLFFFLISMAQCTLCQYNFKKDSASAFSLLDKAEAFFSAAVYDSALYYCDKAEAFSKQCNFKKGIAYALIEKTYIYIDKDELEKAEQFPARTNTIAQQLNDSLIMAIATMQLAQVKMYGNKNDEALALFDKCIKTYFSRHPSKDAALAYNDYGYALGIKGELDKKAGNLIKALQVYETADPDNYSELAITLNNLSTVYYEMNNREKAIEYAKRSIAFREKAGDIAKLSLGCCNLSQLYLGVNNDEALKYQKLCVKYAEQSADEARILHAYVTSSLIASNQKDVKKSVDYELKAIGLLEKTKKDPAMLARRYISVGVSSAAMKEDSVTTLGYFIKAEEQSKHLQNKINLRDVYFHLAAFYKTHNDFGRAYDFYSKHILYRDSIVNSNTASSIADLEKKYQTEKKDNEIARLHTDKRINELQLEKQNALLAGNVLEAKKKENEIALLSKAKELQELQLTQQEEQLEKQLLLAKNNEQQLQLAEKEKQLQQRKLKDSKTIRNFLLGGLGLLLVLGYFLFNRYQLKRKLAEQEALLTIRNNIAKDLHDDIGASLSNINILNELAKRNASNTGKVNEYLERSGEDIQQVSESISDIVWNINPKSDTPENLFIRMKRYAADMLDGKNILHQMHFPETAAAVTMNMEQRRDLYMIFKEAVNNLAKYSQAQNASIVLETRQQQISMTVTDDGKGFDMTGNNLGNGLHNMKQRAEKWQGSLLIQSAVGRGTKVALEMPLVKQ